MPATGDEDGGRARYHGSALLSESVIRHVASTALIGAGFGAFWGFEGSSAFGGRLAVLLASLVALITLVLMVAALRLLRAASGRSGTDARRAHSPFATRAYRLAVLFEVFAIPLAFAFLRARHRSEYFIPVLAGLVGLHFVGLAPAFRSPRFAGVGGAMCIVAGLALLFPSHATINHQMVELWPAVVGFGCALILWGVAAHGLVGTFAQLRRRRI